MPKLLHSITFEDEDGRKSFSAWEDKDKDGARYVILRVNDCYSSCDLKFYPDKTNKDTYRSAKYAVDTLRFIGEVVKAARLEIEDMAHRQTTSKRTGDG